MTTSNMCYIASNNSQFMTAAVYEEDVYKNTTLQFVDQYNSWGRFLGSNEWKTLDSSHQHKPFIIHLIVHQLILFGNSERTSVWNELSTNTLA